MDLNKITIEDLNELDYTVNTTGKHFKVRVYKDFVLKIQSADKLPFNNIEKIVEYQNDLASKVKGLLPCRLIDDKILMPKAPGIQISNIKNWNSVWGIKFLPMLKAKKKEIQSHGYILPDNGPDDIFYDSENDEIYMIDFSQVQKKT